MRPSLHPIDHDHLEPGDRPPVLSALMQGAWRRKSLIALGITVGLALGGLYYAKSEPAYESVAQVLVVNKRPPGLMGGDRSVSYVEDYIATQSALIKSPVIAADAVARGKLGLLKTFAGRGDDVTDFLVAHLSVSRNTKDSPGNANSILSLSFRGGVPEDCPKVVLAIIESYTGFLEKQYQSGSDETLKLIGQARDILEKQLSKREGEYERFRLQEAPLLLGPGASATNLTMVASVKAKKSALDLRRAEVRAQLTAIENALQQGTGREALVTMVRQLAGKAGIEDAAPFASHSATQELLPLLLREQKALQDYGPDHPEVMAIRTEIEAARAYLANPARVLGRKADPTRPSADGRSEDLVPAYVGFLKEELKRIDIEEPLVEELYQREHDEARRLADFEFQDERFRTDIKRINQFYEGVVSRLQDANLVKNFGGFQASIIAPPSEGRKVAPSALLTFPLACCLGLLAGGILAYVAEVTDRTFRSPDDIRGRLGLPVLGSIPFHIPASDGRATAGPGQNLHRLLATYHESHSAYAEAYRGLRTSLYFSTQGEGAKVIQITSPSAGDGKTTLAANLGVVIAQSGKKVLLIDADLRRPRLHKLLDLSGSIGLTSVLTGLETLQEAVQPSAVPNLFLLASGLVPANPAELLTARAFKELLDSVREETEVFDFIIVDSPPLLAVTDPCIVANHADGVLLALRIAKDGRHTARRAKEILAGVGAHVLGVVVNGIDTRQRYYYEYGGYYYGAYSHDTSKENERPVPEASVPDERESNPGPRLTHSEEELPAGD